MPADLVQVLLADGPRLLFTESPTDASGASARTAGFAVSLMGAGTQTIGLVRCDQPRSLDLRARGAKKLETVPNHIIDEVLSKVSSLFD
jgi:mRNA interferase ChpB